MTLWTLSRAGRLQGVVRAPLSGPGLRMPSFRVGHCSLFLNSLSVAVMPEQPLSPPIWHKCLESRQSRLSPRRCALTPFIIQIDAAHGT